MAFVFISGGSGDYSAWFVVAVIACFVVGPLVLGAAFRLGERRRTARRRRRSP